MMPDSNTVAERQRDREEARREQTLPTYQAALDELFDKLLDGEEYPSRGVRPQINMLDILTEQDPLELAELVNMFMRASLESEDKAHQQVKKIVRRYLEGSKWVEMMREEMAREEDENG